MAKRLSCGSIAGAAAIGLLGSAGCAPRLIQTYTVRDTNFVFAVQEGSSYALGECQRAPTGELTNCVLHPVEFEDD